ncbi:hypothetical protein DPMN_145956 [Dreissena polymorpha]|uniref:Uncharacterized protein n=1 Tax=Dreissena polymorpha TaxID=45954 RepID=A0A9D4F509_DREPO|nr:hypothetical protein DPMN_145956 [Dreissena polymorpha]
MEVLMNMETYMTSAICTERTEVLVLEMKNYERLFVKKHQRIIDVMRRRSSTRALPFIRYSWRFLVVHGCSVCIRWTDIYMTIVSFD